MSRSHVSNTTLSLGSTGEPATPKGKKMVWNRRKQQWMEVDDTAVTPGKAGETPTSNLLSSNAYASGVNQNAGNFLTERPITKVHAPPGGVSSISLGDQHTEPEPRQQHQQQQGGVFGTPTQPATPESAESTESRPAPIPMMELPPAPSAVEEEQEEVAKEAAVVPPPAPVEEATAGKGATSAVSSNAYASGTNQNSGNFMTGRPTTRVRAPPGGASSITFG